MKKGTTVNTAKEIRWKQRFQNFERAFNLLNSYQKIESPSEIERAGGIQFFEMCFELAWKVMKDYLESAGYSVEGPRDALKKAFQIGLITNGHQWIDGLDDRNLTVHTYDEETALIVDKKIHNDYFPLFKELFLCLKERI